MTCLLKNRPKLLSDISSSIFDRELRDIKNGFQSVGHPFGSCRLEPGRPQFRSALL